MPTGDIQMCNNSNLRHARRCYKSKSASTKKVRFDGGPNRPKFYKVLHFHWLAQGWSWAEASEALANRRECHSHS